MAIETSDLTRLTVATWNMNHWQRTIPQREAAWTRLGQGLGTEVDVALLQEAVPPASLGRDRTVYREIGGHRAWGSAVVALDDRVAIEEIWSVRTSYSTRRFTLTNTFPGSVAIARLAIDGLQPITLVSAYGVIDTYAQTTLLRIIADLIPLFDSGDGARVILGGDLNVSTAMADSPLRQRYASILGALRGLGLVDLSTLPGIERPERTPDCPCGDLECGHFATWMGGQLDHLFVSPSLVSQVRSLRVIRDVVDGELSDHAAVVATFALDRAPVARDWDPDAFVEEIRRRHGDDDARTVQLLLDWAETKERSLSTSGRREWRLTRFPTSEQSIDPELWIQIDSSRAKLAPLQYTISIRATGDVVVHFEYMKHAPFETPESREPLREALNSIPGVDLPANRLNGRPAFSLRYLREPASLTKLLTVLDRLADETVFAASGTGVE